MTMTGTTTTATAEITAIESETATAAIITAALADLTRGEVTVAAVDPTLTGVPKRKMAWG